MPDVEAPQAGLSSPSVTPPLEKQFPWQWVSLALIVLIALVALYFTVYVPYHQSSVAKRAVLQGQQEGEIIVLNLPDLPSDVESVRYFLVGSKAPFDYLVSRNSSENFNLEYEASIPSTAQKQVFGIGATLIFANGGARNVAPINVSYVLARGGATPEVYEGYMQSSLQPMVFSAGDLTYDSESVSNCVPDGQLDDTLYRTACCSGSAVRGSTLCANQDDWFSSWSSCVQLCGYTDDTAPACPFGATGTNLCSCPAGTKFSGSYGIGACQ